MPKKRHTKQFAVASLFEFTNYVTVYDDTSATEAGRIRRQGKKYVAERFCNGQRALCLDLEGARTFILSGWTRFLYGVKVLPPQEKEVAGYRVILRSPWQAKVLGEFTAAQETEAKVFYREMDAEKSCQERKVEFLTIYR